MEIRDLITYIDCKTNKKEIKLYQEFCNEAYIPCGSLRMGQVYEIINGENTQFWGLESKSTPPQTQGS